MDTSNQNGIDITPEDSVSPTYLIELTEDQILSIEESNQDFEVIIEGSSKDPKVIAAKESAIAKLKAIGLTEEEAKAIAGV